MKFWKFKLRYWFLMQLVQFGRDCIWAFREYKSFGLSLFNSLDHKSWGEQAAEVFKRCYTRETSKGDEIDIQSSPDSKSSNSLNQEEIISLFKRIQSSISKGDSLSSKKRSTKSSEEKPTIDSVLEILRHSKTESKGNEFLSVLPQPVSSISLFPKINPSANDNTSVR